jgi:hypothetical protein
MMHIIILSLSTQRSPCLHFQVVLISQPSVLRQSGSVQNVLELLLGWFMVWQRCAAHPGPKQQADHGGVVAGYEIIRQNSY